MASESHTFFIDDALKGRMLKRLEDSKVQDCYTEGEADPSDDSFAGHLQMSEDLKSRMLKSLEQSEENHNRYDRLTTSQDDDAKDFFSDRVQGPVENEVLIDATQMSSNIGQSSAEGSQISPLAIMPGAPIFSQEYGTCV
ncbi:hypothetical protein B9479_000978 [Cryptococcus floricola]|uniref:Uncharacterized protein n=1 Tax=Cryptococcus floricola TaxID=2591691 RepID=A0A5D3B610_9TREE|nr:hypothetical protein B9479_000978 [Cryptococcus floricola]